MTQIVISIYASHSIQLGYDIYYMLCEATSNNKTLPLNWGFYNKKHEKCNKIFTLERMVFLVKTEQTVCVWWDWWVPTTTKKNCLIIFTAEKTEIGIFGGVEDLWGQFQMYFRSIRRTEGKCSIMVTLLCFDNKTLVEGGICIFAAWIMWWTFSFFSSLNISFDSSTAFIGKFLVILTTLI